MDLRKEIEGVAESFRIMRMSLHAWDDIDNQIEDKLGDIKTILAQPSINNDVLEYIQRERERFWRLTEGERADNIDNMEKTLTGLKVVAVAGLAVPTAVAAYYVAPALLLATGGSKLLTGGLLAAGGVLVDANAGGLANAIGQGLTRSWSSSDFYEMYKHYGQWGAIAGGAGALAYSALPTLRAISWGTELRHPIQAGLKLGKWVTSNWKWVTEKWYRRWAPVPLGVGYGLARNYWVAKEQEQERLSLKRPVPDGLIKALRGFSPSWEQGLPIVQSYAYDKEVMDHLLPALYRQTVTPEAALVLTHILLETLSLHPTLDTQTKSEYLKIMDKEFKHVLENFGSWVLTLGLTGAAASGEGIFEVGEGDQKRYIQGHEVKHGIKDLIDEMNREKKGLMKALAVHEAWLGENLHEEDEEARRQLFTVVGFRKEYVGREYVISWGKTQAKLNDMDIYLGKIRQSFETMQRDFAAKNLPIWALYLMNASPGNVWSNPSSGQLLGWLGGSFFVQGSGPFVFLKAIPFGISAGFISASYTAEEQAKDRQPISMCLPSYGSLCEQL